MKIAIMGTGRIGGTLGGIFAAAGHDVVYGARAPQHVTDIEGRVVSFAEAAQHGEAVLFAIPGGAMLETVKSLDLAGKIIIDATNGGGTAEQPLVRALAAALPDAYVYKAFNTLGFENFQNPKFGALQADMMFIGAESHRAQVEALIAEVGLNPVYVGGLDQTAVLDAALTLWFSLSRRFGRHLAFKVLHDGV